MDATTVAVDLAKTAFELAFANTQWRLVGRQRLNRAGFARFLAEATPTHVVMEACGTAHYWGVSRSSMATASRSCRPRMCGRTCDATKQNGTDAEVILETVRSGQVPTVPVKRVEQQTLVALHRVREQWKATRAARINALR